MAPPLKPPIKPQLARSRKTLPEGEGLAYEPKYDGFPGAGVRRFATKTSAAQSRGGKPLARYFPELRFPASGGAGYVIDGELVISTRTGEVFDALQNRIHSGGVADQPAGGGDAGDSLRLHAPPAGRRT